MSKSIVRTLDEVHESRAHLNVCRVCRNEIKMMVRRDTGICGERCDKADKNTIKE